jgi:carbon monoxide dehydrogenase subunit G
VKLSTELLVSAPAEQAWDLLTDLDRIAPLMPGAALENVDGGEFSGTMSVTVGPVAVKYRGTAQIKEADAAGRRAVISVRGADASGPGQVQAVITAQLMPEGGQTRVLVDTDINISGPLAQFGRGALADMSARLMAEFARNLDAVLTEASAGPGPASAATVVGPAQAGRMDLVRVAGPVLARRAVPVLAGAAAGALVMRWLMRRSQ